MVGNFFVASAYQILHGHFGVVHLQNWNLVRKMQVLERVRFFAWQVNHGRLKTNEWKFRRGLGDPYCNNCPSVVESVLHILRDCPLASFAWCHLVDAGHRSNFFYRRSAPLDFFQSEH